MNHRFILPATATGLVGANGPTPLAGPTGARYAAAAGSYVDVPYGVEGQTGLQNTGFWIDIGPVRATAERPSLSGRDQGFRFIDTTLSKQITWDGANWRDTSGAVV